LESALRSAREFARENKPSRATPDAETVDAADRPVLPELARALQRKPSGETVFASGMMRVVTRSGTTYCLKPKEAFARDGPVEPLSVPTNCP
jgi:hypothetical protein